MTNPSINDPLDEILAAYVEAEEAGELVSRDDLLTKHPDLAEELGEYFAARDQFKRLASPLSPEAARRNDLPATVRYFGDYELLEEIAQGGMGVVYKARQTSLNRIVAVKMILAGHLATDADVQRFADEAQTAASLKHKAIVPIHEVGQQNGQRYFSMDLIEGRNLAEVIRTDPPEPKEAARIIKTIAEAVDYAHSEGIIHRDIKPSNILIDECGRAHITDFGLALRVEGESELTRTGQVLGTPAYMSPEQARGLRDLVGPGSDIYALGAVLYELLTGRPPFRSETAADTIRQLIDDEPVSPRQLERRTPSDLETICLKCLEKESHKRYGTAGLLADDLGRCLAGEPILARPVGRAERLWRWGRREPAVASLTAAVALLFAIGTCVSSYFAIESSKRAQAESQQRVIAERREIEANDARNSESAARELAERREAEAEQARNAEARARLRAEDRRKEAVDARKQAELRLKESHWHLYLSRLQSMRRAWEVEDYGQLESLIAESIPDKSEPDFRGWEWYFLQDQCRKLMHTLRTKDVGIAGARRLAWNPNGTSLALVDQAIEIWDPARQRLIRRFGEVARSTVISWRYDGKQIVTGCQDGKLRIWDVSTGQLIREVGGYNGGVAAVAWSPEGDLIASSNHHNGDVTLWHADNGSKECVLHKRAGAGARHLSWHPDGIRLVSAHRDGRIRTWDTSTRQLKREHRLSAYFASWSPNGKMLVAGGGHLGAWGTIALWNESGQETFRIPGQYVKTTSFAWKPDSGAFATGGYDNTVVIWDSATGEPLEKLKIHTGPVTSLDWSPTGDYLASSARDSVVNCVRMKSRTRSMQIAPTKMFHQFNWSAGNKLNGLNIQEHTAVLSSLEDDGFEKAINARSAITKIAVSPTGEVIAIRCEGERAQLWRLKDHQLIAEIADRGGNLAWSADGSTVAISGRGGTDFWNATSGKLLSFIDKGGLYSSLSPDARVFATDQRSRLVLWNTQPASVICSTQAANPSDRVRRMAWRPDGCVVAFSAGPAIQFVKVPTGEMIQTLQKHARLVYRIAWSPDGRRLASISGDGILRVWDAATLSELFVISNDDITKSMLASRGARKATPKKLQWSHDSRRLALLLDDGRLFAWGSPEIAPTSSQVATLGTGILEQIVPP